MTSPPDPSNYRLAGDTPLKQFHTNHDGTFKKAARGRPQEGDPGGRYPDPWIDLFADCLETAQATGDVEEGAHAGKAELWFVHHLANTLHLVSLSGGNVVDHGMSQDELTASAVLFFLRGLGLREAATDRHYDPGKLNIILQMVQD